MATTKGLVDIFGQFNEIAKRVDNGSLDSESVRRSLQMIIEKKIASGTQSGISDNIPKWYVCQDPIFLNTCLR